MGDSTSRNGRKPWRLTQEETITSFENWKSVMEYFLSSDSKFVAFLEPDVTWEKFHPVKSPRRGFHDDGLNVTAINRKTATQKNRIVEQMLCLIATYCDVIARDFIVKQTTSVASVWQTIRTFYGFQASGAHFLDLSCIVLEPGERFESLYQRLYSFFSDNLLKTGGLSHDGEHVVVDEEMSPTIENTVTWLWLEKIDKRLPGVIKQKFSTDLRSKTLASIRVEISQSLDTIVSEMNGNEAHVGRMFGRPYKKIQGKRPLCTLCSKAKYAGANSHWLSQCPNITEADRKFFSASTRVVAADCGGYEDEHTSSEDVSTEESCLIDDPSYAAVRMVDIESSPVLIAYYGKKCIRLTIDGGATADILSVSVAKKFGFKIVPSIQRAVMVDGVSQLQVVGEVHEKLVRGKWQFVLDALVVHKLDPSIEVIAGIPFQAKNDIATRPKYKQIVIGGQEIVNYSYDSRNSHSIGVCLVRGPEAPSVVYPGECLEVEVPFMSDGER